MPSPAEILRQCLIDQALVTMPSQTGELVPIQQLPGDNTTPCFVSSMPDDPDQVVRIRDTPGIDAGRTMEDGKKQLHPGVQIIIRSLAFSWDLANAIYQGIKAIKNTTTTVNGVAHTVQSAYPIGNITDLGEEVGRRRQLFSINARMAFPDSEPNVG